MKRRIVWLARLTALSILAALIVLAPTGAKYAERTVLNYEVLNTNITVGSREITRGFDIIYTSLLYVTPGDSHPPYQNVTTNLTAGATLIINNAPAGWYAFELRGGKGGDANYRSVNHNSHGARGGQPGKVSGAYFFAGGGTIAIYSGKGGHWEAMGDGNANGAVQFGGTTAGANNTGGGGGCSYITFGGTTIAIAPGGGGGGSSSSNDCINGTSTGGGQAGQPGTNGGAGGGGGGSWSNRSGTPGSGTARTGGAGGAGSSQDGTIGGYTAGNTWGAGGRGGYATNRTTGHGAGGGAGALPFSGGTSTNSWGGGGGGGYGGGGAGFVTSASGLSCGNGNAGGGGGGGSSYIANNVATTPAAVNSWFTPPTTAQWTAKTAGRIGSSSSGYYGSHPAGGSNNYVTDYNGYGWVCYLGARWPTEQSNNTWPNSYIGPDSGIVLR